jgi:hypothetical protein
MLAMDSLALAWEPMHARRAERECWAPLERAKAYPALPATPHFTVDLDAQGNVTGVEPQMPGLAVPPTKLYECVAGIVKTMKLAPYGRPQSASVQANRPPKAN